MSHGFEQVDERCEQLTIDSLFECDHLQTVMHQYAGTVFYLCLRCNKTWKEKL